MESPKNRLRFYLTITAGLFIITMSVYTVRNTTLLRPKASSSSVDFVLESSTQSIKVGQLLSVKVSLETAMTPLPAYAGAAFTLQFDPKLLQVIEVSRPDANVPHFQSIEVALSANKINKTGEMSLLALQPNTPSTAPAVIVGQITFKAIAKGNARLSFKNTTSQSPVLVKNDLQNPSLPISSPLPTVSLTISEPPPPTATPIPPPPTPSPTPSPEPIPPLGASGGPTLTNKEPPTRTDCCDPLLAFDGNRSTFWAGDTAANVTGREWNLYYHYSTTKPAGTPITISYYDPYYPGSAKLFTGQIVNSRLQWTDLGDVPNQPIIPSFTSSREFKLIRLQFQPGKDTPPYIREIAPRGDFGLPSPPTGTPTPLPPTVTPTPLIDETYCHQFTAQTCPAPCLVTSSCPTCRDTTCHAVDHRIPTPTPTPIPIPTNTPAPTVTPRI